MKELSDAELRSLLRTGADRDHAFQLMMRQYQQPIHRFVRRMVTDPDEADDVVQNVFIKAWQGLDRFRWDAKLFSWLYRIAHNECLNHLRSLRRGLFVSNDAVIERLTATLDNSEHFDGDEIQRRLQRAVMRLPDKQRAVFTMKYFEELTYEEIARITGTSVGALKSSYHIAVKKIEGWITADQTR